ncbi:carbohydrate ABC transporter permease [Paenibacillus sp. J2TS4]|uniref:carbohydrate ABC transporter permease n=1 Tax=Paenibacillus sp. J2TS4 TaxID=2807194 RepID=UPI001B0264DE|nr:carbohydrate ABC transporter permease [Paenibacillus sp. J2TS4]GIP31046.1 ABC transporter permease [Paenibacillus sp. J2TS4]
MAAAEPVKEQKKWPMRWKKPHFIRWELAQIWLAFWLFFLGIFMLLPLIYIFNHALKPYSELFIFPPNIFVINPTLSNFLELFVITRDSLVPASRYLFNSITIAILATSAVVIVSALCAYPLSKHKFPGANALFMVIIVSLMFVPETMLIPRYVVVSSLGIMNTYWAHILPHVAAPVSVFLMKQFMDQVPDELLEAAKIDGAREFTVFLRIVMPICMPAVATTAILQFQGIWGSIETSVFFMTDDAMKTFPFFLQTLTQNLANSVARQGAAAAAGLVMFLPLLFVFLVFQRKVIATMAHSGIK